MATADPQVVKAMGEVPLDRMIANMATAVPRAQLELDLVSLETALLMGGGYEDASGATIDSRVDFGGEQVSLLELGFSPTFYQFTETVLEVRVSMTMTHERASSRASSRTRARAGGGSLLSSLISGPSLSASVSTVSASYSSKYGFTGEASSMWRTRLVPLPAPTVLLQRIEELQRTRNA